MKVLHELLDRELHDSGGVGAYASYCQHLRAAFEDDPPPYAQAWYGDAFRNLSSNPFWLIQCLVSNAAKEASGALELWHLAGGVADDRIRSLLKQHAVDESGHSVMYISLVDTIFPDAVSKQQRRELLAVSPRLKLGDEIPEGEPLETDFIIDQVVQINLGEFRTRLHQLLMEPVIRAICSKERSKKMDAILRILAREERNHLRYTTSLLNDWCEGGRGDYVGDLVRRRSSFFNRLTMAEVGEQRFAVS